VYHLSVEVAEPFRQVGEERDDEGAGADFVAEVEVVGVFRLTPEVVGEPSQYLRGLFISFGNEVLLHGDTDHCYERLVNGYFLIPTFGLHALERVVFHKYDVFVAVICLPVVQRVVRLGEHGY
jgi:hypothetical protein